MSIYLSIYLLWSAASVSYPTRSSYYVIPQFRVDRAENADDVSLKFYLKICSADEC